MRLVLRIVFFEFALSWAMMLAGWVRVAVQARPFLVNTLRIRRRAWRAGLRLLIALPVVAGWPLVFQFRPMWWANTDWLTVATPWWILVGACGSLVLVAKVCAEPPRRELQTGCRCGTCVANGR